MSSGNVRRICHTCHVQIYKYVGACAMRGVNVIYTPEHLYSCVYDIHIYDIDMCVNMETNTC